MQAGEAVWSFDAITDDDIEMGDVADARHSGQRFFTFI
jgi:hypothetical protein